MKQSAGDYKRIVVKIGSSLFCSDKTHIDSTFINHITEQVSSLVEKNKEIVLVSSGAIALGMHLLGHKQRPTQLQYLQSISAIGQNQLMNTYRKYFEDKEINVAQVLLTWEDFDDRRRYLNAKNTILTLLSMGRIVPIINENDAISTDEIKFGDNDRLSALVSSLICADILIMLSDVDGLMDKDNKTIRIVDEITPEIKALASPTKKKTCVGGMITKVEAAKITTDSGIPCVIANGRKKHIVLSVLEEPQKNGTLFVSKKTLSSRERWIAFGTKAKGVIIVDDGAKYALINKKSLLSVGVTAVDGNFAARDIVSIEDKQNKEFARGRVSLSSKKLDEVKGRRLDKEVIHRNDIVIL